MSKYVLMISVIFFLSCKRNVEAQISIPTETPLILDTITTSTVNFKGLNWADPRDNFVDDWLVLTGLNSTDNYTATLVKSDSILAAFSLTGANTIRLPINPPTVLQNWWASYRAAIDRASAKGMKVIIACWEGASSKDGIVDNESAFWEMWNEVVNRYKTNANVYFEVFNEPHGYNISELKVLYLKWLANYADIPKRRILLDGVGYANDVNSIGDDNRFDSCLLSYHEYTWFDSTYKTVADWEMPVKTINYPKRTVVTEFGIPMTNGKNYLQSPGYDVEITYFQGMTNQMHDLGVGGVYWPGLRAGDSFSLLTYNGVTAALTTNNISGITRLQYAWGTGNIAPLNASFTPENLYKIINRNSNKSLDVNDTSITAIISQWDYSASINQQWKFTNPEYGYFSIVNTYSNKFLSSNGAVGTKITQNNFNGLSNQRWQIIDIGFGYYKIINKSTEFALDVNGSSILNGGAIIQWNWNDGINQQWQILQL